MFTLLCCSVDGMLGREAGLIKRLAKGHLINGLKIIATLLVGLESNYHLQNRTLSLGLMFQLFDNGTPIFSFNDL